MEAKTKEEQKYHGTKLRLWDLIAYRCDASNENASHMGNTFGRLFPEQPDQPDEETLIKLSEAMREIGVIPPDSETPIGFAFLGQFIDHDITLDATTQLGRAAGDVTKIENLRTPRLELDSVYLDGREGSPYLYNPENGKILNGTNENPCDLQRNVKNTAIIGDPRNDENLFISQLHGLFIRYHNALIDQGEDFEKAQEKVRWTYQWIVVNEFLPAIIAPDLYETYLDGLKKGILPGPIDWANAPSIPVEFSAAAYRFGHSHVRQDYQLNDRVSGNLFEFGGFNPVLIDNNLDWKYFFDLDGYSFRKARPINTMLAEDLFNLPFIDPAAPAKEKSLAARNLIRGQETFKLPFGEDIARQLAIEDPIETPGIVKELGMNGTPLWYYILAEAEQSDGKLNKVGGHIVAGTLLQMLLRDEDSYIYKNPYFQPFDTDKSSFAALVTALSPCEGVLA